jgi:hypothetical protein
MPTGHAGTAKETHASNAYPRTAPQGVRRGCARSTKPERDPKLTSDFYVRIGDRVFEAATAHSQMAADT